MNGQAKHSVTIKVVPNRFQVFTSNTEIPDGIKVTSESNTEITVSGDREDVNRFVLQLKQKKVVR